MSQMISNASLTSKKSGAGYKAQGDSPLAPWEILNLRNKLISTNDMWDLQIFVMIILSVRLALRENECESIQISSFENDLFIFNNDGVLISLCLTVMVGWF
jgi:hypothetical protein